MTLGTKNLGLIAYGLFFSALISFGKQTFSISAVTNYLCFVCLPEENAAQLYL